MTTDVYVKAGGVLLFSEGEYSDYCTVGLFVALENISRDALAAVRDEISGTPLAENKFASDRRGKFVAALIRRGLLMAVPYTELHIGSYNKLELNI